MTDKKTAAVQDILQNILTEAFKEAGIEKKVKVSTEQAAELIDAINDVDKPVASHTHPLTAAQAYCGVSYGRGF